MMKEMAWVSRLDTCYREIWVEYGDMSAITVNMRSYRPWSTSIQLLDRCAFIRCMFAGNDAGNVMIEPSRYMLPGDMSRIWRYECNCGEHASILTMIDNNTPARKTRFHQTHVRSVCRGIRHDWAVYIHVTGRYEWYMAIWVHLWRTCVHTDNDRRRYTF